MTVETPTRMKQAWSRGSYDEMAVNYLDVAARLVETTDVEPDNEVLDVGCGTGSVAITAARRGATVSGVDITSAMIDRARENAELAGVDVEWRQGDATDLPFDANAFDVTLSSLGHMYGDPPDEAADELVRVTRPGGRIGFTAWTPMGLLPVMAGLVMSYLPRAERPDFSDPPFAWGDRSVVDDRLGDDVTDLSFESGTVSYPALSPAHFWDEMATHSGVFDTFLEQVYDREELRTEMIETIASRFDDAENAVELEYLTTTATIRKSH